MCIKSYLKDGIGIIRGVKLAMPFCSHVRFPTQSVLSVFQLHDINKSEHNKNNPPKCKDEY